ncbi:MAG: peptide ABC transporter substrate-binding protein [Thermomicrobiales bacterium]
MYTKFRSPIPRPLAMLAACLLALPLLLTACGGSSTATDTPKPQATTGGAPTAASGAATSAPTTAAAAATKPAGSAPAASGTTAPSVAAPLATTASGTAASASAPAPAVANLILPADSKRGAGGTLKLLWWQAPTILNLQLAQGTKDYDASRLVEEPLASFTSKATTPDVPVLAKEILSVQNGAIAADGTSVTWKLKDGVTWSDGTPFTADDVIFTWKWIVDPKTGATNISNYEIIKDITAKDPMTLTITFKEPTAVWYLPFTGVNGAVLPKHVIEQCADSKGCGYNLKPIGTGPFIVTDFKPGDSVQYKANEKFREPNAPYFAAVDLKGGGDATTAAKAVQTGQVDYAWNIQVTPDILKQVKDAGAIIESSPAVGDERIFVNFADPSIDVNGEKSSPQSKSPFWTDKNVRQALALAVDRKSIADNLYGADAGYATNTTIPGIYKGSDFIFDPKKANDLLDAAGWKKGSDGIREKDGKKFAITFRTSITSVRDREAQIIKSNLKDVGIAMEIKNVDSGVFFGQPDNPDNRTRFEVDLEMYTNTSSAPDMQQFFSDFTSDKISQKSNGWKGTQIMRWVNPEYDAAVAKLKTELNPEKRIELFKQIDQILVNDYAQIPLVARLSPSAHVKGLDGVNLTSWDSELWNAAHWTKK